MDLGLRDCTGVRDFRACFGRVRCGLGALGPTRGSRSGSGRWVRSGREERRPPRRDAKGALSWAGAGDGLSSVSVASPTWALYLYGVNVLHREVRSGDATASPTGGPGYIVRGILRMNEVCPFVLPGVSAADSSQVNDGGSHGNRSAGVPLRLRGQLCHRSRLWHAVVENAAGIGSARRRVGLEFRTNRAWRERAGTESARKERR